MHELSDRTWLEWNGMVFPSGLTKPFVASTSGYTTPSPLHVLGFHYPTLLCNATLTLWLRLFLFSRIVAHTLWLIEIYCNDPSIYLSIGPLLCHSLIVMCATLTTPTTTVFMLLADYMITSLLFNIIHLNLTTATAAMDLLACRSGHLKPNQTKPHRIVSAVSLMTVFPSALHSFNEHSNTPHLLCPTTTKPPQTRNTCTLLN